jgi:hypothetical protein
LVEGRHDQELAGFAFGVTLQPSTPWWHNLTTPLPPGVTTEHPGRTFALVELLVQVPRRATTSPRSATRYPGRHCSMYSSSNSRIRASSDHAYANT